MLSCYRHIFQIYGNNSLTGKDRVKPIGFKMKNVT